MMMCPKGIARGQLRWPKPPLSLSTRAKKINDIDIGIYFRSFIHLFQATWPIKNSTQTETILFYIILFLF